MKLRRVADARAGLHVVLQAVLMTLQGMNEVRSLVWSD